MKNKVPGFLLLDVLIVIAISYFFVSKYEALSSIKTKYGLQSEFKIEDLTSAEANQILDKGFVLSSNQTITLMRVGNRIAVNEVVSGSASTEPKDKIDEILKLVTEERDKRIEAETSAESKSSLIILITLVCSFLLMFFKGYKYYKSDRQENVAGLTVIDDALPILITFIIAAVEYCL